MCPTGYTSGILDNISFKDFALRCARGFGACVSLRDEHLDTPIPTFFPSDFYLKKISSLDKELEKLDSLTEDEVLKMARDEQLTEENREIKYNEEKKELQKRYVGMLNKVGEWEPPTKEHEGLKKFMIEQINNSIKFDCNPLHESLKKPKLSLQTHIDSKKWFDKKIKQIQEDKERYFLEHDEELKKVKLNNKWITQLKESL